MQELTTGFQDTYSPEQFEEMFRNLNKDERIKLLALICVRRGAYPSSQWKHAISDASVAYDERAAAGLNDWLLWANKCHAPAMSAQPIKVQKSTVMAR